MLAISRNTLNLNPVMQNYNKLNNHILILNQDDELKEAIASFVLKQVGYPRSRAWADELDSRCSILVEDYALKNGYRIAHSDYDQTKGVYLYALEKK